MIRRIEKNEQNSQILQNPAATLASPFFFFRLIYASFQIKLRNDFNGTLPIQN